MIFGFEGGKIIYLYFMSQYPHPSYLLELDVLILPVWETVSTLLCSVLSCSFSDSPTRPLAICLNKGLGGGVWKGQEKEEVCLSQISLIYPNFSPLFYFGNGLHFFLWNDGAR